MLSLIINIILGVWLIISPYILLFDETRISDFNNIAGPVIISFEIISFWEAVRQVRKANFFISIFLFCFTFITLTSLSSLAVISNMGTCAIIALFSLTKSKLIHSFGGGWHSLFEKKPLHLRIAEKTEK